MNKLFNLITLFLLLVLFAMPAIVQAQEPSPSAELPAWTLGLPSILLGLVAFNFKTTEAFKRMLASERFGYTPPKDVQGVLVLGFSVGLGIASAWVTPYATEPILSQYPAMPALAAVLLTGFGVSVLGGLVYELLGRLSNNAVYTTSTTISSPASSSEAPKETMAAVAQAVKS